MFFSQETYSTIQQATTIYRRACSPAGPGQETQARLAVFGSSGLELRTCLKGPPEFGSRR